MDRNQQHKRKEIKDVVYNAFRDAVLNFERNVDRLLEKEKGNQNSNPTTTERRSE